MSLSGDGSGYAVKSDGTLWAWGDNSYGQLGNGSTTASYSPVLVLTGITHAGGGRRSPLALSTNGTVWAWGETTATVSWATGPP